MPNDTDPADSAPSSTKEDTRQGSQTRLTEPGAARTRGVTRFAPRVAATYWSALCGALAARGREHRRALLRGLAASWARTGGGDAQAARAVALTLADLILQGWTLDIAGLEVWIAPPVADTSQGETPETVKARLREGLQLARAPQLSDRSVRAFINRVESRRGAGSVLDLVDDGRELAEHLRAVASIPRDERVAQLDKCVRPVVEVALVGTRCRFTGVDLFDVWRYFRHSWSLEYRPTPGRALPFLVRNAARPNAPIMAIGALASPTLQMRTRDEWIGWSAEAFTKRITEDPPEWSAAREVLLRTLEEGIALVRADDLYANIETEDVEVIEQQLRSIAEDARSRRSAELDERAERQRRGEQVAALRDLPTDEAGHVDWRAAADRSLWVAKRARTLADLRFAQRVLAATPGVGIDLAWLTRSGDAQRALKIASREVRKVGLASRVLELNVCGAVPPYRELLGGKLAALAVGSAELMEEYSRRYGAQPSEIASQVAGREVVRTTDVCLITTTSLYGVTASQYNRLKVEVEHDGQRRILYWEDLGLTGGYGTIHLGEEATRALRDLSVARRGRRNVNNVFGEGQSPRMRQIREALDDLGIEANLLLRHSTPRRVYAMKLTGDALEQLRENRAGRRQLPSFAQIAAAWTARWLSHRIEYAPALDRVAGQGPRTIQAELRAPDARQLALPILDVAPASPSSTLRTGHVVKARASNVQLIRDLYRGCDEHHDPKQIRALHVVTAVDDFLRERAKRGGAIFVTGNPGDGKTHLLRQLEAELQATKVQPIYDANEQEDEDLRQRIEYALKRPGRGVAIAINEGILVNLIDSPTCRDAVWAKETRAQLLRPFMFGDEAPPAALANVCVVDLNLRNNLAPDVVRRALHAILENVAPCAGCPGASKCALQYNAARLPAIEERVVELLDLVGRSGFHATMRDLQGFLSYLLFGGTSCEEAKAKGTSSPYWTNAFEGGQGPLFEEVLRVDPKTQTAPLLDDLLWRNADRPSEWVGDPADVSADRPRLDQFLWRKRRALFEHREGRAILRASEGSVDDTLKIILEGGKKALTRLVRLINQFFDRDEDTSNVLYLWVTHRYDARPSRYAASSIAVPVSDLEVVTPRLRPEVEPAFKDFRSSFVVLRAKKDPAATGLRVDRALVTALMAGQQGLPSTFRRGEPEARVSAFFDRLSRGRSAEDALTEVRLVDMDTGVNLQVGIDLSRRVYSVHGARGGSR